MVLSVSGITREPQASGMLVSGRNRKFIETNWLLREQAKGFAKIHCPIVGRIDADSCGPLAYRFNYHGSSGSGFLSKNIFHSVEALK